MSNNTANPQATERTLVDNPFGVVTDRRVVYYRAKTWFSGGSREDIPLQHVTSVRTDISRSIGGGIVLLLIGLGLLSSGRGVATLLGLLVLVLAIILLWGSPVVIVNTAGHDLSASRGFPWQRPQANAFVEALRGQLFKP